MNYSVDDEKWYAAYIAAWSKMPKPTGNAQLNEFEEALVCECEEALEGKKCDCFESENTE